MIFYSQTSNGIAFLIDENASSEIAGWNKGIQLTSRQLASLQSAGNPTPNYSLRIILLAGEIILEVARDTVGRATIDRFNKAFESQQVQGTPSVSKIVPFLDSLNNSQAFILWIGSGYYEDLTNWKIWIASEALSGRYIYEFFYSRQPNGLDGFIEDTLTGEKFALDPWADVYDGPLAD